ncbi:MAG TPA: SGNH/GDSL hydrolase family protein [Pyrinomonadaceae bacterium]|nr:SGNH/GDSL hydrolase family protein [Pyrinomonadaceae bacterium]
MVEPESDAPRWSRKRRVAIKLLVVFCALLVGLFIAEIALRIIGYSYPVFYTTDLERGYALSPGAEGWYRKENKTYVRINSRGLRDREHALAKPPDTLRLAVVGDSYAEALQVRAEEAFWAVIERELQTCGALAGRRVEVINFGVSGYGTTQELLTLRKHVWDYSPDIVLLAVTTNNDITDNSRTLKQTDEIPYFVRRDGRLVLDDSFLHTRAFRLRNSALSRAGRWIRDRLRFVQAIHEGHGAIKAAIAARGAQTSQTQQQQEKQQAKETTGAAAADVGGAASGDVGIDNMIYREPADEVWREAWSVTEQLLVLMRDEVESRGARFFVATLSNGGQVHPNPKARAEFAARVGATDLLYPDLRLRALGERTGFTVWNLAPELQVYAEQQRVYLHGFGSDIGNGHWNETGHRVAGQLLAQKLCEALAR